MQDLGENKTLMVAGFEIITAMGLISLLPRQSGRLHFKKEVQNG